jgi:uncharacterized protein YaiE (UPF0345 family)
MQVNRYFEDKVLSIGFESDSHPVSSGVMQPGEFSFGTSQPERMVVTHGEMLVRLPDGTDWQLYPAGTEFNVAANVSFDVKVTQSTCYLCYYG